MSAQRVILLRHGRTTYNAEGRFQGQTDIPLDQVGLGQIKQAADTLAVQLAVETVRIVSSDLQRAARTAAELAARLGLELTTDVRLREIYAGQWQGLLREEIMAEWPAEYSSWFAGENIRVGGGETRSEAGARAAEVIAEVEAELDGGTLVCVGHGAALRGAILHLLEVPGWPWNALGGLDNAHWAELRKTGRGWRLASYNLG